MGGVDVGTMKPIPVLRSPVPWVSSAPSASENIMSPTLNEAKWNSGSQNRNSKPIVSR